MAFIIEAFTFCSAAMVVPLARRSALNFNGLLPGKPGRLAPFMPNRQTSVNIGLPTALRLNYDGAVKTCRRIGIAAALMALASAIPLAHAQLRGHGGPVRALAIAPDGASAISGSFDTSAIRWSLAAQCRRAGAAVPRERGQCGRVARATAAPSPAARTAASRSGSRASRARRVVLEGHTAPIVALAVSPRRRDARVGVLGSHGAAVAAGRRRRRACSKAISRTSTASPSRPTASALVSAGYDADRAHLAARRTAAPDHRQRCRRRSMRWRVAPDGEIVAGGADGKVYFLSPAGELRGEVEAGADADHRRRGLARRHARRRRRHPRLGRRRSNARSRTACAHAGRARAAGLVGRVPARQPHAAHRRHRPHGAALGRGDRRAHRRGRSRRPDDPLAAYAGDRGAEVYRACVACHTLTPDEGNRAGPTLAGIFGRRIATLAGLQFLRGAEEARHRVDAGDGVEAVRDRARWPTRPAPRCRSRRSARAEDREALMQFLEKATKPK